MISFARLGSFGRLANQMFQYATVRGVSMRLGYEARIPRFHGLDLIEVFDVPEPELTKADAERLSHTYTEPHFAFSDEIFRVPDDTNLQGYYQSQRYFQHCEVELRESLRFKREVRARADMASRHLFRGIGEQPTPVSLHVRRGDYLDAPNYHPVCTSQFYEGALALLEERFGELKVLVFSDDIAWCRQSFRGRRFQFSAPSDQGTDLCLMSRCHHHIIANSSYSWWGAWLNPSPDKVVIAPKAWFGPDGPQDTQDLLPPEWLRL